MKNPDIAPMIGQRRQIEEISRLAVPATFRRHRGDPTSPIGELSIPDFSQNGRRGFPHIPVGLYLAAAAIGLKLNIDGVLAMMELRPARHLHRFRKVFEQAHDVIAYHGQWDVFYINRDGLFKYSQPEIKALLDSILSNLETSLKISTFRWRQHKACHGKITAAGRNPGSPPNSLTDTTTLLDLATTLRHNLCAPPACQRRSTL